MVTLGMDTANHVNVTGMAVSAQSVILELVSVSVRKSTLGEHVVSVKVIFIR